MAQRYAVSIDIAILLAACSVCYEILLREQQKRHRGALKTQKWYLHV